jgi:hypothetical protein
MANAPMTGNVKRSRRRVAPVAATAAFDFTAAMTIRLSCVAADILDKSLGTELVPDLIYVMRSTPGHGHTLGRLSLGIEWAPT